MKRKDRSAPQPLATGTAERLAAIVEAAEQAAVTVIDDAEKQARRRLEEAEAEAERIVSDRLDSMSDLIDSLVSQAEAIKEQSEQLLASLAEVKRRLATAGVPTVPDRNGVVESPARPSHLSAVAAPEEPAAEPTELRRRDGERGTPAGARLLATQMAVSGNSREEIEARLRNGFDLDDTDSILDAILGPEE